VKQEPGIKNVAKNVTTTVLSNATSISNNTGVTSNASVVNNVIPVIPIVNKTPPTIVKPTAPPVVAKETINTASIVKETITTTAVVKEPVTINATPVVTSVAKETEKVISTSPSRKQSDYSKLENVVMVTRSYFYSLTTQLSESNEEEDVEILDDDEISKIPPEKPPPENSKKNIVNPLKPVIRTDIIRYPTSKDYLLRAMDQSAQSDRYKYTSIILDRYQKLSTTYIGREHQFKSFRDKLLGVVEEEFVSPFTGNKLSPFIWRDFGARPVKMRLLEEIVAFHHLYNK
jgi:hypothetical protein